MGQDIRELLKNNQLFDVPQMEGMSADHELRFLDKLNEALPEEPEATKVVRMSNKRKATYAIAASAAVVLALGGFFFSQSDSNLQQLPAETVYNLSKNDTEIIPSLADVSPEFKKVEDYYLASINVELANLKVNEDNKSVIDSFMKQLSKLDEEYKNLQKDLHSHGTLNLSLEALIDNLQMRLELLQQLKLNLKNINESNSNTYQNLQA